MKSTMGSLRPILPTDFRSLGVPWLMEAAACLYGRARMADRIPQVANPVISNVTGPPVALYMAGARRISHCPASIVVHGMALNLTVQSHEHALDFGLMADGAAMPDGGELAEAIRVVFDDLRMLAGAVKEMVTEAVQAAVPQSTGPARKPRPASAVARRMPGSRASVSASPPRCAGCRTGPPAPHRRAPGRGREPGGLEPGRHRRPRDCPGAARHRALRRHLGLALCPPPTRHQRLALIRSRQRPGRALRRGAAGADPPAGLIASWPG